jgi:multisubunit Na+/H+ antiporter MnhC subunit
MNEGILFVILAIVIIGFAIIVFMLNARLKDLKSNSTVDFLKADMTEL